MAQLNFDARTVVPDSGQQDPVPAGWYSVVMDKSEMKPTKDGTGMRLEMQFKIIDGQYTNRKVFEGLNLQNSNPTTQEIAYKQLSAIAHAVNVLVVEDSSQLHNIPLKVKLNLKPAAGGYDARNEVKAYKNINEVTTAPAAAAPLGAPAAFGAAPAAFAPPPAASAQQAWAAPAAAQPWAAPAAAPAPVAAPVAAAAPAWAPPAAPASAAAPAWAAAPAAAVASAPAVAAVAAVAAPIASAAPAGVVPPWATAAPTA